ncbi:response regulator transcription factor [Cytobacillus purgationiresistens]|uniref:Heme response regulator HssR n=1 Tax=Cytobacillus purgationiresistens TaxID=863449 RepID=A0ABU0AHC5_9BACI|nr:response regulator transcription factor [Cytobacillus purgationiresistens]MDQ0270450.1 DNA-binding response OmpR family regulator [Cytobacillus purgationiresistens]
MKTVLIVDDDQHVRYLVKDLLLKEGFRAVEAADGNEALAELEKRDFDLAIADIMMPNLDGYGLTEQIRTNYDIPVILLTAKGQIEDKEKGYLLGTDDYLVKPFEPKELLFRVNALLRRYGKAAESSVKAGPLFINKKSYEVEVNGKTYILPLKEFDLLHFFASRPNQVFSRAQLIENVWGLGFEGDERTVDVHIKRLRERFTKLGIAVSIKTIRGVGYSLEVN